MQASTRALARHYRLTPRTVAKWRRQTTIGITPHQAWDATPVAEPPRPDPVEVVTAPTGVRREGSRDVKIQPYRYVYLHGIKFQIAKQRAGQIIHAV